MDLIRPLTEKDSLLVIGLMSGTSADGMDAALTRITGYSTDIRVETLAFETLPYTDEMRREILRLAAGDQGGSRDLALFHFRLGEECLKACLKVCEKAGIAPEQVDLVGSHGQAVGAVFQEDRRDGSGAVSVGVGFDHGHDGDIRSHQGADRAEIVG